MINADDIVTSGTSILFVTLDSLRYDVARSAYDEGMTPHLAALLPEGGWQRRQTPPARSPSPLTWRSSPASCPSCPSRSSRPACGSAGRLPSRPCRPRRSCSTLPASWLSLGQHGYRTICVGGVTYFSRETPLGSVLPAMFDEDHWRPEFCSPEIDSTRHQVDQALDLADRHRGRPLLLFVNVSATHVPPTATTSASRPTPPPPSGPHSPMPTSTSAA
ncbi:hypothetical protein GCM10020000_79300 [Streptomyces olivoverticillatus]